MGAEGVGADTEGVGEGELIEGSWLVEWVGEELLLAAMAER
ncbi:hypothetical protein A2U01_0051105, partial [Trifolium medium]|nr:hypothetical protein [Trifolium medium]